MPEQQWEWVGGCQMRRSMKSELRQLPQKMGTSNIKYTCVFFIFYFNRVMPHFLVNLKSGPGRCDLAWFGRFRPMHQVGGFLSTVEIWNGKKT